jgi:CheY-like chemotaxis protein
MPEMDGFELLGIIRKDNSCVDLPIIIYTSSTSTNAKECISKGSNFFVQKYGDPKVLISKIEEALSVI